MVKKILIITNLLTLSVVIFFLVKRYSGKPVCQYELRNFDFHYRSEPDSPKIVMLGNSLIRRGNWDSLLGRKDIINRGIEGDNLSCICERLTYLKNSPAKICFIEGGINDMLVRDRDVDTLFNRYKEIVHFWKDRGRIPVINLVTYVSPLNEQVNPKNKPYKTVNTAIKKLNEKLMQYAGENEIDVIDLNKRVSDEEGLLLKAPYTIDGLHFSRATYLIWAEEIQKVLSKHEI